MDNGELLTYFTGIVLSLGLSYIPGLSERYDKLDGTMKRLFMLLIIAISAVMLFALGCFDVIDTGLMCDRTSLFGLLKMAINMIIANQATYMLTPTVGRKEATTNDTGGKNKTILDGV